MSAEWRALWWLSWVLQARRPPHLPVLMMQCGETPRTGRLNKLGSDAMFFLSIDDDNFGIPVLNNASGEQSAMLGNICERYGNKFDL